MAIRAALPGTRYRAAANPSGQGDVIDQSIYGAIVVAHGGGVSATKAFTKAIGDPINVMAALTGIAPTETHHTQHDLHSTNLTKQGEVGAIGDAAIRNIALDIEQAAPLASGAFSTYGMTPADVVEFMTKIYCKFMVAGLVKHQGSVKHYPCSNGAAGAVALGTTASTTTKVSGLVNNGPMGGRRIKVPLQVGAGETIAMEFTGGHSAALVFSVTSGVGQASLVTTVLSAFTRA